MPTIEVVREPAAQITDIDASEDGGMDEAEGDDELGPMQQQAGGPVEAAVEAAAAEAAEAEDEDEELLKIVRWGRTSERRRDGRVIKDAENMPRICR